MSHSEDQRAKQMRKGTRSLVFGAAILIGLAVYKMAQQIPQLQDFGTLLALVTGATVFALLRRLLL